MNKLAIIVGVVMCLFFTSDFYSRIYRPVQTRSYDVIMPEAFGSLSEQASKKQFMAELDKIEQAAAVGKHGEKNDEKPDRFKGLDGRTVGDSHVILTAIYAANNIYSAVVAFYPEIERDYKMYTLQPGEQIADFQVISVSDKVVEFSHPDGRFSLVIFDQKNVKAD